MTTDASPSRSFHHPLDAVLKGWIGRATHGTSPAAITAALEDWLIHLGFSPGKQATLIESALRKQLLWLLCVRDSMLDPTAQSCAEIQRDKRFAPPQWDRHPFDWQAQAFLLIQQWWHEATTGVRGVSMHHEQVTEFVVRQWLDMWSPSNFVATNPQVLEETWNTGGRNLVQGLSNWWRDAVAVCTDGAPAGVEQFKPGRSVAITPGKVVFRNRLIELIRYDPATPSVHPEPVLLAPAWIMKFYILDLSPQNSLVRYLVGQGHTVFMISWKNPDASDRDLCLNDYLELGVLTALREVSARCPDVGVHGVGYCLGGTLLAMAAAALARSSATPLKTLTLLAAQIDFEEPGELGLFIDESQVAFLEDLMAERGCLDGRQMAGAFALINSKDLVWSKLVHEYLMGNRTPLTDLRAWNADATRMPQRMHSEYLRRLYLHNELAEGCYEVQGRPVAVQDIRLPLFVVATERDHVSPWRSVYKVHLLTDGDLQFVLSSGGHNVGIVNPPEGEAAHPHASHRVAIREADAPYRDPQAWYDSAELRPGSWWPTWQRWLAEHSGPQVPVERLEREATGERLLGDAPGSYVHQI
ncbi:alpha/beta fold hydrolase [Aquabacterium sp. A7-Y]|uniref:PHA/PHB synthase family protein n=1 Tax=Aquabacterium sp. A7-Y TaxID=1349605 RepID=UPI00223CA94F|nr:alpha/beta fold hydrolase [Aquabacterium sp. A7-Y]MCW7541137.1 alpha/beta fold hydrolase [Aquabacterium sp. A7-Y]